MTAELRNRSDLTTVVNAIRLLALGEQEAYDDPMNAHVGYWPDLNEEGARERLCARHGWTYGEVVRAAEERTSGRCVHFTMGWL